MKANEYILLSIMGLLTLGVFWDQNALFLMLFVFIGYCTILLFKGLQDVKKDIDKLNDGFSFVYERMSKENHRKRT